MPIGWWPTRHSSRSLLSLIRTSDTESELWLTVASQASAGPRIKSTGERLDSAPWVSATVVNSTKIGANAGKYRLNMTADSPRLSNELYTLYGKKITATTATRVRGIAPNKEGT